MTGVCNGAVGMGEGREASASSSPVDGPGAIAEGGGGGNYMCGLPAWMKALKQQSPHSTTENKIYLQFAWKMRSH